LSVVTTESQYKTDSQPNSAAVQEGHLGQCDVQIISSPNGHNPHYQQ